LVDISKEYINVLKRKVEEEQLSIEVIEGNILLLQLTGSFDGAFCLGNSFGYFNFQGMETFLDEVQNASLNNGHRT